MPNTRRFEGKRVMVTGGAKGIGRAVLTRFAAEGATMVLTDINPAAARRVILNGQRSTAATLPALHSP